MADARTETPADALRTAALDALNAGRPAAVDALLSVAGLMLTAEKIDSARRRNLIEAARWIPRSVTNEWGAAVAEFGRRLIALAQTLPGALVPLDDEVAIEALLTREIEGALSELQRTVDAISAGDYEPPAAEHPRAA